MQFGQTRHNEYYKGKLYKLSENPDLNDEKLENYRTFYYSIVSYNEDEIAYQGTFRHSKEVKQIYTSSTLKFDVGDRILLEGYDKDDTRRIDMVDFQISTKRVMVKNFKKLIHKFPKILRLV